MPSSGGLPNLRLIEQLFSDNPRHFTGHFHLRKMAHSSKSMLRYPAGQMIGVRNRQNAVIATPDRTHGHGQLLNRRAQIELQPPVAEKRCGDALQCLASAAAPVGCRW